MPLDNTEILDDSTGSIPTPKRWLHKVFYVTLAAVIYMFLMEYFRSDLPDHLFSVGPIEIRFSSIAFLVILLLYSYFIPFYLEQGLPAWSVISIALCSGVLFFVVILLKVFLYNYFILHTGIQMNFGYIFFTSGLLGVLAGFTSNIRILRLRERNTYIAWIFLFIAWYGLTTIATM